MVVVVCISHCGRLPLLCPPLEKQFWNPDFKGILFVKNWFLLTRFEIIPIISLLVTYSQGNLQTEDLKYFSELPCSCVLGFNLVGFWYATTPKLVIWEMPLEEKWDKKNQMNEGL